MASRLTPLVHTEVRPSEISIASDDGTRSTERGSRSSAGEHPLHTGRVAGSIPAATTVDLLADMLANQRRRMDVEARFWPKVMRPMDWESCWPWKGATSNRTNPKQAYGSFKVTSYFSTRAHRVAYALYYGKSPGELLVCHKCDNPVCVNPTHLFLGTNADNMADMAAKGRAYRTDQSGDKNKAAKLSAAQVDTIRARILGGQTNVRIARDFGVTHQMISRIRRGRSWGEPAMQPKYASLKR